LSRDSVGHVNRLVSDEVMPGIPCVQGPPPPLSVWPAPPEPTLPPQVRAAGAWSACMGGRGVTVERGWGGDIAKTGEFSRYEWSRSMVQSTAQEGRESHLSPAFLKSRLRQVGCFSIQSLCIPCVGIGWVRTQDSGAWPTALLVGSR
jgi:hypothetical protein